jgi:hypothetical protein
LRVTLLTPAGYGGTLPSIPIAVYIVAASISTHARRR